MYITLADAKLFTVSFGPKSAPAILTLSGWIGSWEDWLDPLSILSEKWRVIAYDHRGSGATIAPVESITFDHLIDDVFAVLDAYGVDQCVLAAMSMGAAVAYGAVLKQPERFSGLVIVNGIDVRSKPQEDDPFLSGLKTNYHQTLEAFIDLCVPEQDSDHIKHWGRQILGRAAQEAAIALYHLPGTIDLSNHLKRITQPALILHGDADSLVPVESARWLAQTLPNAELVLLEGVGHVPIMTRPTAVAREIERVFGFQA